jgi:hypothetical protein
MPGARFLRLGGVWFQRVFRRALWDEPLPVRSPRPTRRPPDALHGLAGALHRARPALACNQASNRTPGEPMLPQAHAIWFSAGLAENQMSCCPKLSFFGLSAPCTCRLVRMEPQLAPTGEGVSIGPSSELPWRLAWPSRNGPHCPRQLSLQLRLAQIKLEYPSLFT